MSANPQQMQASFAPLSFEDVFQDLWATSSIIVMEKRMSVHRVASNVITDTFLMAVGREHGFLEVNLRTQRQLHEEIEYTTEQLLFTYLHTVAKKGNKAGDKYVTDMRKERWKAYHSMQKTFDKVASANARQVSMINAMGRSAVQVKLAAAVGVAVIGATAGVIIASGSYAAAAAGSFGVAGVASSTTANFLFAGVGLGTSATMSVARNWSDTKLAGACGMDFGNVLIDTTKAGGKVAAAEMGSKGAEAVKSSGNRMAESGVKLGKKANKEVNKLSKRMFNSSRPSRMKRNAALRKAARQEAQVGEAMVESGGKAVQAGKFIGKTVPVFFAAWDILDAAVEYNEDMKAFEDS